MKKFLILLLLFGFSFADDVVKGQTYYLYLLKDHLGYNGAKFTKQHTQKEWETLFDNNAKGLKAKLVQSNPDLESFIKPPKFKKITPYLKAFTLYYAKDIKNAPSCGE